MQPKNRITGFDLARAYAIFGMFIVNFNVVFGNYHDQSYWAKALAAFSGNSSTVFVLLAGMGIALMSNRATYTFEERKQLVGVVNKRALFLFCLGLLLYNWWPADILHFYGGYMHIGMLLLFVNKRYYLFTASAAILVFHLLTLVLPFETGWDFEFRNRLGFRNFTIPRLLDLEGFCTKYVLQWLEPNFSVVGLFHGGHVFG